MASLSFVRALAGLMLVGSGFMTPALAQIPQIPVIPALMPTADQVAATQPMPIDGTWLISTIRQKIRIEGGRAFAVDGWRHAFVFQIEPGMVVFKDFTPTAPGSYTAQDLTLMGQLTAEVQSDRSLAISVKGILPIKYKLIPLQLDNPQWYAQEMAAVGLPVGGQAQPGVRPAVYQPAPPAAYQPAPPPTYQPQPQPPPQPPPNPGANSGACEAVIFNPRTGQKTCAE